MVPNPNILQLNYLNYFVASLVVFVDLFATATANRLLTNVGGVEALRDSNEIGRGLRFAA